MFNRNLIIHLKYYLTIFFLFYSAGLFAQNIPFKHFTTDDGLSNNKISNIIQDRTGFIWLASDDGLNRFDGYGFKVYRHKSNDYTSISNNSIWTLFEDRAGFIWIGTKSGEINRYDPNTDRFKSWEIKSEFVKENSIKSIYEDSHGAIWIGTYKSGLYRFDPVTEKIENWRNDPLNKSSLSNNYVTSIVEDADGNLLISTYIGLNKFNYQKSKNNFFHFFYEVNNSNTLSNNLIWSLSKSKNDPNLIWIGTADGLTSYRSDIKSFSRIPISNPQNIQFGMSAGNVIEEINEEEKLLWIDSYAGLIRINQNTEQTFRYLSQKNSSDHLISNQINKIFKDRSGVTWIATENGLSYFSSKSTKFNNVHSNKYGVPDFNLLKDKNITAITQTSNGTIWVGTDNGLYQSINANGKIIIKKFPLLDGIHIWSLTSTEADDLWIGTYGSGLIFLDVKNNQVKKWQFTDRRLQTQSVLFNKSVLTDDKNNLWIGFWGLGLAKINDAAEKFELWQNTANNNLDGISHNDVWVVYRDSKNRMWIGTNGGGLNLFIDEEKGKFIRWQEDETQTISISGSSIYSIIESKYATVPEQTILWIGTNKGLNKFVINNSTNTSDESQINVDIIKYSIKDGLADISINGILEDADGNLWLGTNSGITLFEVAENKFTNFTKSDGIIGSNFNTASAFRTQIGLLLFGSSSGLNYFDPKQIIPSSYFAPVVLTDFQIFNQSISAGEKSPLTKNISTAKEVILTYNQNVFSIEFAALDYNSPQSIHYAYMMEGFDKDWIESGSRRFVTYTNLSSGTYKFKVKATNADGIWNDKATELAVIIKSPWWATGWAYIFYVLVIVVGLYIIRRFELNRTRLKNILRMQEYEAIKQKELDETKSRFFANLSHEFRTPLMLIKGPLEQLIDAETNVKNIDRYKMIHRNTENLQSLIDQLLELTQLEAAAIPLKAKKENLLNHLRGMISSFESLADDKKIKLNFNSKHDSLPAWIDKDKLEKIIYNLLSNAFKFTPDSGSISVDVKKNNIDENEYAEIKVSDTGIGIPQQKLEKIFDRFYQVDDSNQRSFGGSGIGLALVKELIDLHKWNISVTSELNNGTEFTIRIPLWDDYLNENQKAKSGLAVDSEIKREKTISIEENDFQESDEVEQESIINNKPSILIVEDSSDVRLYLYDLLKSEYMLYEAANGREGISVAQEKIPDLIISDVMMPEMDGMEFCRRIKTDWLTSHIPVIMLTAKASGESKIQGLETGADDYLTKPFNSKELFVRVKNLLDQRKRLREKFSKEINPKPKTVTTNPLDEEFLQKAFSLAEKNLDNVNFDTEAFAKDMFLSRMQLHRKLQAITGQTPGDFVRSFRLKRAAQLLKEKRLSITQISFEVGYNSPSQFTKAFAKQFNCSPSEYLNKIF